MRRRRRSLTLAVLAAAGLAARPACAQTNAAASLVARLDVITTGLTATTDHQLDFGTVTPGVAATIGPRSALAGKFIIKGEKNLEISVAMTLPTVLVAGTNTMPISFAPDATVGQFGCQRNQDQQTQCAQYDPRAPLVVRIRNNPAPGNTFFVWIGGKVTPAVGQRPGFYKGDITMTVTYTGN
jgi:hypothetical protein